MSTMLKSEITQAILQEYIAYDINTGFLTWIKKISNKVNVNTRAGSYVPKNGYRVISLFGKAYPEHHVIWCWVYGYWPPNQIDHIDHNRANNALANLREVSIGENARNRTARKNTKVREHGIWYCRKRDRYISEITYEGKKVFQRTYPVRDIDRAIKERNEHLIKLGFHPNHGK